MSDWYKPKARGAHSGEDDEAPSYKGEHRDYARNVSHGKTFCQNMASTLPEGMKIKIYEPFIEFSYRLPEKEWGHTFANRIFLHEDHEIVCSKLKSMFNLYYDMAQKYMLQAKNREGLQKRKETPKISSIRSDDYGDTTQDSVIDF